MEIYPLIFFAGAIAGFINTLAGSGSLITLPLLIFVGLPANVANGTNRIAILLQSIAAVGGFRRLGVLRWRDGLWLAVPATIGAIVGAVTAVNLDEELMNRIIGGLLLFMFLLILVKPERWIKEQAGNVYSKPTVLLTIIFIGIGFYGGFIQAGVGFFLLAGLVLGAGMDLVRANAVKMMITLTFTVFSLAVFIANGQVDYTLGFVMGAGSMVGAWFATQVAVSKGAPFIRWFLLATVLVFSVRLLFF